jgi:triosephosphate isomerase
MRKPIIAGNWKLFKTNGEAADFMTGFAPLVKSVGDVEIIVAPPFTAISSVARLAEGSMISIAGQNCFWETEGAFTGEISPAMLIDAGCSYVIIGHSERRQFFGETDQTVNKKIKSAIAAPLTAILCIGETLEEREREETFAVLERQVVGGLSGISAAELDRIVVAYEPVWAIGTGRTASDEQAQDAHAFIRTVLARIFGQESADGIRILYGGSVKPENITGLMAQPDIDGALVGGASLKPDVFARVVNFHS